MENINIELKRLDELILATTKTKKAFAKRIQYDPSLLTKILKGEASLTDRLKKTIFSTFSVNPDWWETGCGPMFTRDVPLVAEELLEYPERQISIPKSHTRFIDAAKARHYSISLTVSDPTLIDIVRILQDDLPEIKDKVLAILKARRDLKNALNDLGTPDSTDWF